MAAAAKLVALTQEREEAIDATANLNDAVDEADKAVSEMMRWLIRYKLDKNPYQEVDPSTPESPAAAATPSASGVAAAVAADAEPKHTWGNPLENFADWQDLGATPKNMPKVANALVAIKNLKKYLSTLPPTRSKRRPLYRKSLTSAWQCTTYHR